MKIPKRYYNAKDIDFLYGMKQNKFRISAIMPYLVALSPLFCAWIVLLIKNFTTENSLARGFFFPNTIWLFICPIIFIIFITSEFPKRIAYRDKSTTFKQSFKLWFKQYPEVICLILMMFWVFFSIPFQSNCPNSLLIFTDKKMQEGAIYFFGYILMFALFLLNKDRKMQKSVIIIMLIISCMTCVTSLIFNKMRMLYIYSHDNTPWAYMFVNSNHYAYYLCLTTTLSATLFCFGEDKFSQIFGLFSLVLHSSVCILNDTLGCNLAILFIFILLPILLWIKERKFNWNNILPLAIFVIISFVAYPFAKFMTSTYKHNTLFSQIVTMVKQFFNISKDPLAEENLTAGTNRWKLWLDAFRSIKETPIFGNGNVYVKPHNEYLQWAVHFGLPALAFYLSAIIMIVIKAFKNLRQLTLHTTALLLALACYLVNAFFGNTMPHTFPFFLLILAFSILSLNQDIAKSKQPYIITQEKDKI